jgi:PAS domain S-box-containing protein
MIGSTRRVAAFLLFFVPDLIMLFLILYVLISGKSRIDSLFPAGLICILLYVASKPVLNYMLGSYLYVKRIRYLKDVISNFKKGKYSVPVEAVESGDTVSLILKDLSIVGRHFDDIVSTQKDEIEKFKELYNNIVLSVSSYFIVLNDKSEIIFANESFCKNFQYQLEELVKRRISEIFYFTSGRVDDSIEDARKSGESVVLKSMRLMSKNRVAIIADVKISLIKVHGENQIVFLMDDVTSKARKDYQISLISQISESIQKDDEIDRVLFAILTAVTSGSGLGFNRAMLFLSDEVESVLVGRMAVGPDTFEEAIQIWGALQGEDLNILEEMKGASVKERKGQKFYEKVVGRTFPMSADNVFTQTLRSQKSAHLHDVWNDPRADLEIREFMDVNEFVVAPLVAGNRSIGLIIADNKYNHAPIWHDNIELLSIFAVQAALSIESCNSLSIVRDQMGKIKARQDAIVESEKLAAVGRIAAHIAHEIRNPLVTVGGYARRILQQTKGIAKGGESIKQAATVILQETERLEKILSNVMDFTRPSTYIREYNNLNDIITDTVSLLKNVFQERKIECVLNLNADIPLIKSDYNQLKQVVLNLFQNAMDAMEQGGRLESVSLIDVPQNKVVIYIRDTGVGIKEENIERLFEPFFTTKVTGVGLGLAVVKKIINDHDGEITVRNRPEGGTEFRIEFSAPGKEA